MSSITFEYNTSMFGSLARIASSMFGSTGEAVSTYFARKAAERRLMALDDRMLSDIGVDRTEIHNMVWGK